MSWRRCRHDRGRAHLVFTSYRALLARRGPRLARSAGAPVPAGPTDAGRVVLSVLSSRLGWLAVAVVAVVALGVGSVHPSQPGAAERISHLDSLIKCPSCVDLSIAQSDAAIAVGLRAEVAAWVHQGLSDSRIEQLVVARFGEQALLVPSGSGADVLLVGGARHGPRRGGWSACGVSVASPPPRGVPVSLGRPVAGRGGAKAPRRSSPDGLVEEREFLRRSMEDLEDEHASARSTTMTSSSFAPATSNGLPRSKKRSRISRPGRTAGRGTELSAETRAPTDPQAQAGASHAPRSPTRRHGLRRRLADRRVRKVIAIAATACFAVAATLLAASLAGVRLPGESATGSVTLSSAQQEQETLDRAAILGSEGQVAQAVQLYDQVLRADPNQPDALAYDGWLIRLAGLSSRNRARARPRRRLRRTCRARSPLGYPDAHALWGVILYEDFARPSAAAAQFREALAAGASKNLVASVAPVAAKAFAAAGIAPAGGYAAALKSEAGGGTG